MTVKNVSNLAASVQARVRFIGLLGKARVTMQIDVGFGDVVTPGAQDIIYPALLHFPVPALSGYPRETVSPRSSRRWSTCAP
ncbi:MAG: hypothetical protein R3B89_35420 [Polyangiaceae bacterium]